MGEQIEPTDLEKRGGALLQVSRVARQTLSKIGCQIRGGRRRRKVDTHAAQVGKMTREQLNGKVGRPPGGAVVADLEVGEATMVGTRQSEQHSLHPRVAEQVGVEVEMPKDGIVGAQGVSEI